MRAPCAHPNVRRNTLRAALRRTGMGFGQPKPRAIAWRPRDRIAANTGKLPREADEIGTGPFRLTMARWLGRRRVVVRLGGAGPRRWVWAGSARNVLVAAK
jgi:hypothetical protein